MCKIARHRARFAAVARVSYPIAPAILSLLAVVPATPAVRHADIKFIIILAAQRGVLRFTPIPRVVIIAVLILAPIILAAAAHAFITPPFQTVLKAKYVMRVEVLPQILALIMVLQLVIIRLILQAPATKFFRAALHVRMIIVAPVMRVIFQVKHAI
ncbi:MAG: hypothetical protein A3A97_02000 [Candidatus Terrybacteria bacterium RIFCSPLOWO2_01_FULL_40_23]|uniref:Uncharacterized protein n=1 Tax=Candidatus Terrybacteria bacterium RIFCSPLOWO2_01_FULL_40_23 TaxID=1802366 RepID=A0A1G2PQS4_9BACT|nr:MAG: hypothetical protein A3A97_02000 [Candidatus Terrybacteria bacterium RIFCSPLOWO2_01_FULL_40_23]